MKGQNYVGVNLTTNQTTQGELNIPDDKLQASAKILANILLDYVRNGGSTNHLTLEKVFGKGGHDE
ncbi:MAG: hypothetical protein J1F33_06855 [Clostridiales bacterium]|nr:hypothetical protein [Clostridiales bacterium]